MPKTFQLTRPDLASEVQLRLKQGGTQREMERLQALRLGLAGQHTLAEIGAAVGRARSRIAKWMRLARAHGVAEVLGRHQGRGRAPQVKGQALKELSEGLRRGRWKRAKEARAWLIARHGITLTEGGVRYWLKKTRSSEASAPQSYPQRRGRQCCLQKEFSPPHLAAPTSTRAAGAHLDH